MGGVLCSSQERCRDQPLAVSNLQAHRLQSPSSSTHKRRQARSLERPVCPRPGQSVLASAQPLATIDRTLLSSGPQPELNRSEAKRRRKAGSHRSGDGNSRLRPVPTSDAQSGFVRLGLAAIREHGSNRTKPCIIA
ncbi:hypothetical protein L226DRAFT_310903 [Lentinus tigrinus ALCF2SS1-7]|uniref:uncharacterized protein n=1 Tax=Lentinus tigrinus ALCF2SS1-7 TaxID=1328758 RepID=UPI0011660644|nr:hypothetical protein L226DRAFT_310903 [Lentinus tigrinus ALCF2SS1-7]